MPYIDERGKTRYTLKERYNFYKDLALGKRKTKDGKTADFLGQVASANKTNRIRRKMGKNVNSYNFHKKQLGK